MYNYWAFLGVIYLSILTYQDYKNNRLVDDRFNAIMLGLTISLISHTNNSIWYLVSLTLILLLLYAFLRKTKPLGEGDINSVSWIFYGFGIISPATLILFIIIFSVYTILYYAIKFIFTKIIKKSIMQPTAFYGVIWLSFLTNTLLNGFLI